jgi:hypothetical protein
MEAHERVQPSQVRFSDDPRWLLVQHIVASPQLKSSARLCDFLSYVAECALRVAPEAATEQQIGICVFGRKPGYNSSEDSIVRTHARILRQKLAAYFAEDGKDEPLVIDMPKGHYLPVFRPREAPAPAPAPELPPDDDTFAEEAQAPPTRNMRLGWAMLLLFLILAVTAAFAWRVHSRSQVAHAPVEKFWQPFFANDPPLVIYSNALFTGDSTQGLRYAPASQQDADAPPLVDTYTGVGELAAVYSLTRLFDRQHAQFILKRSMLVTWDEAKVHNLIFIGAPVENPSLRVLQPATDFTLVARQGSASVVNLHPRAGEQAEYSRPEHPLTRDYAILALLPGVQPGNYTLIFSGLMTYGTQAAVEYTCNSEYMSDLLKRITGPHGEIRPFEAVLETSIGGGVPLQTHLVVLHVH